MSTRHVAVVTDPTTAETTTLTAPTETALDALIDEHLERSYPQPPTTGDAEEPN